MSDYTSRLSDACLSSLPRPLLLLVATAPFMSIEERKPLLTMCRVQGDIRRNKRLQDEVRPHLNRCYRNVNSRFIIGPFVQYRELVSEFSENRESILVSSFGSMILRCAPYIDDTSPKEERWKGIIKEIQASQLKEEGQQLNYESIFFDENAENMTGFELFQPWNRAVPSRPMTNLHIRQEFLVLRKIIPSILFLPRFQARKTVGRETARRYQYRRHGEVPIDEETGKPDFHVSSADLLSDYHYHGIQIGGPCEVRVAWKYNDLKPRVYYAQGGTAFFSSLYIQQLANLMVNLFLNTNVRTRYSLARLAPKDPLQEFRHFMLHDYSSFTSQMEESRHFMYELASFFDGVPMTVLDVRNGPIEINCGEYLWNYTRLNLDHPEFSLERLEEELDGVPMEHRKAGMLGVYGNISLCTLLHGLFLSQVSGDESANTCVGDDGAHFVDRGMTPNDSILALQSIGKINADRFILFENEQILQSDDQSWHFIKRRVEIIDGFIVQGRLLDFPMMNVAFDFTDPSHTVTNGDIFQRRRSIVSQVGRFFDNIAPLEDQVTQSETDAILKIFRCYYHALLLPISGSLPPHSQYPRLKGFTYAIPPLSESCFQGDWLTVLLGDNEQIYLDFPRVMDWLFTTDVETSLLDVQVYDTVVMEQKPGMSLLKSLGYLGMSVIKERYIRDSHVDQLYVDFVRGRIKPLYNVTLASPLPAWWIHVENSHW
jgi:hypothetical protein